MEGKVRGAMRQTAREATAQCSCNMVVAAEETSREPVGVVHAWHGCNILGRLRTKDCSEDSLISSCKSGCSMQWRWNATRSQPPGGSPAHTLTWKSTPPVTTYLWPGPATMQVISPLCAAKPCTRQRACGELLRRLTSSQVSQVKQVTD